MAKAKHCNYVVWDVETGGLKPSKNPITEIALVIIDGVTLEELARYSTYVKPYANLEYDQAALDYTGITMAMINGGVDFRAVVKQIIALLKEHRANTHHAYKPLAVGHNVQFDLGFIEELFRLAKEDLYKHIQPDYWCTMRLDQIKNYPTPGLSYKLEDCCDRAGVELIDGHAALNDTVATKNLFVKHIQTFRSGEAIEAGGSGDDRKRFRDDFQFELSK